jgi:hypothetical protein
MAQTFTATGVSHRVSVVFRWPGGLQVTSAFPPARSLSFGRKKQKELDFRPLDG